MPQLEGIWYSRIDGIPICTVEECKKKVECRGGIVRSERCYSHTLTYHAQLMEEGLDYYQANARIWAEAPRVRLVFTPG